VLAVSGGSNSGGSGEDVTTACASLLKKNLPTGTALPTRVHKHTHARTHTTTSEGKPDGPTKSLTLTHKTNYGTENDARVVSGVKGRESKFAGLFSSLFYFFRIASTFLCGGGI